MIQVKCKKCGKIMPLNKVRTIYQNGKKVYINPDTKKEILCEDCKGQVELLQQEGNFQSSYSQFSTLSPLEKQKLLRKRSQEDAKKQKYVEQEREKVHYGA